jgi:hypothetical protein
MAIDIQNGALITGSIEGDMKASLQRLKPLHVALSLTFVLRFGISTLINFDKLLKRSPKIDSCPLDSQRYP